MTQATLPLISGAPSSSSINRENAARQAVALIYSSYPDFNKTPKEFLATIVTTLMQYPESIIYQIADRRTGIQTQEKFPPTVAHIMTMAEELIAKQAIKADEEKRYAGAQARRSTRTYVRPAPFRPFPALWEAFADEPAVIHALDHPGDFGFLDSASRLFAMSGKDAAREYITPSPVGAENGAQENPVN